MRVSENISGYVLHIDMRINPNISKYIHAYPHIPQQHPTYISNVKRLPNIPGSPKYQNTSENSEGHSKCQSPPGPPQTSKSYI